MKKIQVLAILMSLSFSPYAQEVNLNTHEKETLLDMVVITLKQCIENFGGTYRPGTTIEKVEAISDLKYEISGTVNYRGQQCGNVNDTPFKLTVVKEGSQSFSETCIYSPYCIFGVETGKEWDCECKKWQYGGDENIEGAWKILMLLQEISQN